MGLVRAPQGWKVPSVDEVIADAESMGALQLLVDMCCDGGPAEQKRALGIFLQRLQDVPPPQRRPRVLMARMEDLGPQTATEAQALLAEQAHVEAARRQELAQADPDRESIHEALKSTPKVARMPPEQLLDDLIRTALKPLYLAGHKSFDIRPKWKGQNVPVYADHWAKALQRNGINAPEPACQAAPNGGLRVAISFADLAATAPVGRPAAV